ncbi:unnamed protein product [Amoebophrya sp. A25]|nr:unnamed protein product [Amoebophrya sp. A25]|eukprot:GSA25T00018956001.1
MLEVYLPAAGCVVVGLLHGLKYSCRKDKTWHRVAATALFGAGGIGYIKIYRGDRDWFRYVPYAKQPTYMKQNFPFYVSSYCFAFLGCFGTRETYVRFMSRYLLPPK